MIVQSNSKKECVVLVNEMDIPQGLMEKMEAHVRGKLHRAFSVFVTNPEGDLLLQRRALTKYHSPGLWTNTCCSHPREGEKMEDAAVRRLTEEMGFTCSLKKNFDFIYRADVGQGLIEHEFDHVLTGVYNGEPAVNPEEVMEWKYMPLDEIYSDMLKNPESYTVWFRIAFEKLFPQYYISTDQQRNNKTE